MNYFITIVDRENELAPLELHFAEKSSIVLKWLGADEKIKHIISSTLSFSLLVKTCDEGLYEEYFTNKEDRFIVTLFLDKTKDVIWRGHLLPETYKEPYHDETFFVYFTATDGLGLLKGKELPENFYKDEIKLVDYLKKILSLTKLNFNLFFSPAVINQNKEWGRILINGEFFEGKNAYQILEDILISINSQLYQADNKWYIDGFNKRQMIKNSYDVYRTVSETPGPEIIGTAKVDRNVKKLKWVSDPEVSMIPTIKTVTVIHKLEELKLPEKLYKTSEKDFFVNPHISNQKYLSPDWQYTSDYYPTFYAGKPNLFIKSEIDKSDTKLFALRQREYVKKGESYNLTIQASILLADENYEPTDKDREGWMNKLVYEIAINDVLIATNRDRLRNSLFSLRFDENLNAEVKATLDIPISGFLNIRFFNPSMYIGATPWGTVIHDTRVTGFWLNELSLELVGELKGEEYTKEVDADSSIELQYNIPISQDLTNRTPNFQLEKRFDNYPVSYGIGSYNIFKKFVRDGKTYYSISLEGASAASIFNKNIYIYDYPSEESIEIPNAKIIFNYENGDLFLIEDPDNIPTVNPAFLMVSFKRTQHLNWYYMYEWEEWADAIYPVQKKPFLNVSAEIIANLYEKPFLQVEGDALNSIKFNDIIVFPWQGENKYFVVNNVEWNIGLGYSKLLIQEAMYKGKNIGEYPPYVYAGDTIVLEDGIQAIPSPIAYSPDGIIENYLWEEVTNFGSTILNEDELIPVFDNLIFGNEYVFKLTVTDNYGNIVSDTIKIEWRYKIELIATKTFDRNEPPPVNNPATIFRRWTISQNSLNTLPSNYMYNLHWIAEQFFDGVNQMTSSVQIVKNGQTIYSKIIEREPWMTGQDITRGAESFTGVFTMLPDDIFEVELYVHWGPWLSSPPKYSEIQSKLTFTRIDEINGNIEVINLPLTLENFIGYGAGRQ